MNPGNPAKVFSIETVWFWVLDAHLTVMNDVSSGSTLVG